MGRSVRAEEFVTDIVEALKLYGGAAHRSLVVERVAIARNRRGAPVPPDVHQTLELTFERHLLGRRGRGLFHRPFGEGSHRWALVRAAA
jgi:hypothetical protein